MSKLLYIIKHVLFITLIVFMKLAFDKSELPGIEIAIFVLLTFIYALILIKDFIKKPAINYNNRYNLISILIILIFLLVIIRFLYDPHLIYNNKELMEEITNYSLKIYGEETNYGLEEINVYYLMQNMIYFNILYILIFIYRKFNLKEK